MSETLKPCPYCQERIQPLATKCRYCKEILPEGWSNRADVPPASSNEVSSVRSAPPTTPVPPILGSSPSKPVAGYATPAGVLALIAAILALIVPVIGVLWFSPIAIVLGIAALKGGARGYGIAVLVIVAVNMIISPTFWLNIGAGSTMPGATGNRIITYINVFGVLGMILMLFSGRLWTTVAAVAIGVVAIGLYSLIRKPWFRVPEARPSPTTLPVAPALGNPSPTGPQARASKAPLCESHNSDRVTLLANGVHDTYVGTTYQREGSPSSNTLAFGGWGDRYVALLKFDIPAVPPARSAILCMFAATVPPNDPHLLISRIVTPWEPTSVTISSLPRAAAGIPTGPLNAGWNAFDITLFYQTWVQSPDSNFGIQLAPTRTDQTNGAFASSEYSEKRYRPRIVVTFSGDHAADTSSSRRSVRNNQLILAFDSIVQNKNATVPTQVAGIDELIRRGLDLNAETPDGATPIRSVMDNGAVHLVAPLISRGLSVNASRRSCNDQYWYAQSIASKPGGLAVLDELSKAGFREDCLVARGGRGGYEGFVCGVMFGASTAGFDVSAAVRAVEHIASLGFDVGAKCLGHTIPEAINSSPFYTPEQRQRLMPITVAVQRLTKR